MQAAICVMFWYESKTRPRKLSSAIGSARRTSRRRRWSTRGRTHGPHGLWIPRARTRPAAPSGHGARPGEHERRHHARAAGAALLVFARCRDAAERAREDEPVERIDAVPVGEPGKPDRVEDRGLADRRAVGARRDLVL